MTNALETALRERDDRIRELQTELDGNKKWLGAAIVERDQKLAGKDIEIYRLRERNRGLDDANRKHCDTIAALREELRRASSVCPTPDLSGSRAKPDRSVGSRRPRP